MKVRDLMSTDLEVGPTGDLLTVSPHPRSRVRPHTRDVRPYRPTPMEVHNRVGGMPDDRRSSARNRSSPPLRGQS
jgi:hypothetical protein